MTKKYVTVTAALLFLCSGARAGWNGWFSTPFAVMGLYSLSYICETQSCKNYENTTSTGVPKDFYNHRAELTVAGAKNSTNALRAELFRVASVGLFALGSFSLGVNVYFVRD